MEKPITMKLSKTSMKNSVRNLGIVILAFCLLSLLLCSCSTPVSSSLPEFSLVRPHKPQLQTVDNNIQIPNAVTNNTILLIGYIEELETYAEGWESFYNNLRNNYDNN